jgi:hypothetical protein
MDALDSFEDLTELGHHLADLPRHDITEILLKVALNTIQKTLAEQSFIF